MNRRGTIFLVFTSAYFLSYFYRSANAVIAPELSGTFALSASDLGLMTGVFFATFAFMQIPLGVSLDRWGARWVTPALMLAAVAGSLVFALAASFGELLVGRALIGAGMAGVLMGSFKAFSEWYPPNRFATYAGLLVGIGASGALVAATPFAWLNQTIGWRAVFAGFAGLTLLIALAIVLGTRNRPPGAAAAGAAAAGAAEAEGTILDIFGDIRFWRIVPLIFFWGGSLLALQGLWAGPYLSDVLRLDDIAAGNVLLFLGIGVMIGYLSSGWLSDRFGLTLMIVVSAAIACGCQLALALRPPLMIVSGLYAVYGFTGAFHIMMMAHARHIFPPTMTGKAITAVNLFSIGGTFLLQWWLGIIIGIFRADEAGHYPPEAYSAALIFTAAGTLIALLWYLPLVRRDRVVEG